MPVLSFPQIAAASTFDQTDLQQISILAEGLSQSEVADYMMLDLNTLRAPDMVAFNRAYAHGRAKAVYYAYTKLKENCVGRGGTQAALAILARFSNEWKKESFDLMDLS